MTWRSPSPVTARAETDRAAQPRPLARDAELDMLTNRC